MTWNVVMSFIIKRERWKITEKSQAVKDARRRLVSLTTEMYTKGCFTARYLSILITNKWISETPTRQLITSLKTKNGHSLLRKLSKIAINHATSMGWTNIPTGKSVVASRAIMKLDLWALNRRLVFTAIITNAFKTTVKGKVKMLMVMFKVRAIWTTLEGCCSLPPKKAYSGHSWWIAWLEFMASFVLVWSVVRDRSVWILIQLL